jgi:asparagine synthase (glutamine-hydrolysing)
MCGITGIFSLNNNRPIDTELLDKMTSQLVHRGPDESGFHVTSHVGFGFRRLSIIDVQQGNQPHFNEDRRIVSVCNGEIYNFKELRQQLCAKGHQFRTHCDVEVIVHLYEEYQSDFVRLLNGQFAFALFDQNNQFLLLARDPIGITPLFYTQVDQQLLFASEIKALLQHPGVSREVNLTGLDQIMTFPGFISPTTMFTNIHSVAPGHDIQIHNGHIRDHEYWDLIYPEINQISESAEEDTIRQQVEEELLKSVRYRLHADVPVGFYLSGGLDSSLIASMIHHLCPNEKRHSFSITFPDKTMNEKAYQDMMAHALGSIHHEREFQHRDILDQLQKVIWHTECPLKESYDTCSLVLSQLVHDTNLKVVLTGEGADELFGGYVGYRLDETRYPSSGDDDNLENLLEQEVREKLWGDPDFFYEQDYYAFNETKLALFSASVAEEYHHFSALNHFILDKSKIKNRHPFHMRSYIDFKLRIADHLVADHGDRVAYANSVEARYPFLDHQFINAIRHIPPQLMIKNATEKYLLRKVAEKYVPPQILQREKFGFVAPSSPYLLNAKADWVQDLLSFETIQRQGYFNPHTVERCKKMVTEEGTTINTTFETDWLMIVLTFGIFLDTFSMPNRG